MGGDCAHSHHCRERKYENICPKHAVLKLVKLTHDMMGIESL